MNGNIEENHNNDQCIVREQDRFMPIANVIRIMRKILPPHAKISDDAKETIQECVSEYISFITGEANDRCQKEQRKTITAEDVLWAMSKLGFDDYTEPLTLYLHRYREFDGGVSQLRGTTGDPHPVMVKRGVVDPPSSAFHLLPPRHHQLLHGPNYGNHAISGGGFHHVSNGSTSTSTSTSQPANANGSASASGSHHPLAPTPEDQ